MLARQSLHIWTGCLSDAAPLCSSSPHCLCSSAFQVARPPQVMLSCRSSFQQSLQSLHVTWAPDSLMQEQ